MSSLDINFLRYNAIELQKIILEKSTPKNVLITVGFLSVGFILYKTLRFVLRKRKYRHIPGPPTKGLFGYFIGNLPEIQEATQNGKVLPDLFVKWHQTYGDVFKFQMLGKILILTADKDAIKEVLITKNFPKEKSIIERIGKPMGARFLGAGLVTETDKEAWKHRRGIFNPGFHRHVLMTFVNQFNTLVNTLSDKLRSNADNKTTIYLMNELNKTTLDAIALIAFGMNTDSISQPESVLNVYLSKILGIIYKNFINPFYKYNPKNFKEVKELHHMVNYLRDLGREKIKERINAFKNNEHMPDDILSSILASNKGGPLELETMIDDFITFFVAGQETTANTLSFSFLEMGKNPEIVKKAREEIDRVLGERSEVTYQDVSELKYCSAIFKESLRMYPPAAHVSRTTPYEMNIQGYTIPENSPIWISTYMNGRSEKFYKDPLEFKPERFLKNPDSTESGNDINYVYLPFSLGPRNCIGQNFAQLEGVIVIAKLLQKFDFRLDKTQSLDTEQNMTLRPKDGVRCFVSLRS